MRSASGAGVMALAIIGRGKSMVQRVEALDPVAVLPLSFGGEPEGHMCSPQF
jgi:hypothetical protein